MELESRTKAWLTSKHCTAVINTTFILYTMVYKSGRHVST